MENEYKHFFNFLGAWFADSDFEEKTEEEIVSDFKKTVTSTQLNAVILEAQGVKSQINKYWVKLSDGANIYFGNGREAELWLDKLIELLKQS